MKKRVNAKRVDVFDTDILASFTGVHSIPCSICGRDFLNFKSTALLSLLSVISRSVCFSLKPQWTHQCEFSSSFSS